MSVGTYTTAASPRELTRMQHTITVERPPEGEEPASVRWVVVERLNGRRATTPCRDIDVQPGRTIQDAARTFARLYNAEYVELAGSPS